MTRTGSPDPVASVKQAWGKAIKEQRLVLAMSQARLAKRVGVDQSLISYWEHGTKAPTVEKQLAVAKALGVAPRVLFQYPDVA